MKQVLMFFILLVLYCFNSKAQLIENFDDGDFTANPVWSGDVASFIVNPSLQLQSSNTVAGSTFYLSTPSATALNAQWEIFVNLKFATSGANYTDVFLISDVADINNLSSGYFVRIGGTPDEVSLFRNDIGTATKIIDGADGRISSSSNNIVKIKVTRDASGLWTLNDSVANATPVVSVEGTVSDNTYTSSQFFGISVTQSTASFFSKHYFDSIYAGPIITDNIPPQLVSATATSINTLDVLFNEPVDPFTSQTLNNYSVDKGIGIATTAAIDIVNNALIHLSFGNSFIIDTTYTVTVTNVEDVAGNIITAGNTAVYIYSPPKISNITVTSQNMIDVKFTEELQLASAENLTNYAVNNSIGNPTVAIRDASDSSLVHLTFTTNFTDALLNTLTVNNISSVNNIMVSPNTTGTFTWFAPVVAAPNDIIINEIMAAPTGSLGLPNAEYVELFNRSSKNLNLFKWTLHDATGSSGAFPNIILAPDSFIIVCSNSNVTALSAFGNTIGVSSFPSLNNTGDNLSLYDSTTLEINHVAYDETWYQDSTKISNGYSLERIDKNFPCPTLINWAASAAIIGGTPGTINSINSVITDTTPPIITNTVNVILQSVTVVFNESMDVATLSNVNNYSVDNGIGVPILANALPYSDRVILQFAIPFQAGILYTISFNGIADCSGNLLAAGSTSVFQFELPIINSVTVISQNAIDIKFSMPVQQLSAEDTANYVVNNGIGNPLTVLRDGIDSSIVHLTFTTNFTDALLNTVVINNVTGINDGIIASNSSATFTWFAPVSALPGDIIFNEIMAAPTDLLGLPNAEYVEIYNRSSKNLNLTDWTLHDASGSSGPCQNLTLTPGSYLIICSTSNVADLSVFGNAIGIGLFPSLNNSGDNLTLYDNNNQKIDEVNYSDSWYHDPDKTSNGYSLERIDQNFPCPTGDNWSASNSVIGGTPGNINSINGIYFDSEAPLIKKAYIYDPQTIMLFFNEAMDESTLSLEQNYSLDQGIGSPAFAATNPYADFVILQFAGTFQKNITYTLTVSNLKDCSGNLINSATTVQVAIADTATDADLLINEILFNPYSGGYDFVELYNNSNKIFDLRGLKIANADLATDTLNDIYEITSDNLLLFPGDYLAITENPDDIKLRYSTPNPNRIIKAINLPTFNDDEGKVVLLNENFKRIDQFRYSDKFHYPLINDAEGVSLERLSFTRPTQDSTNWQSAAQTIGFATPAYKNSQAMEAGSGNENIEIIPRVFSPDEDGYNDVLSIRYHFNEPGLVVNATVFDSRGRVIQYVARNVLVGEDATLSWNGINLDNEKAKIGIYVLYSEIFNTAGDVRKYKNTFVVAGKLK